MHLPFEEGYRQEAQKYLFRANILKYGFFVSTDGGVRMRDADKTKGQLIEELARLRREIARLQRDNKRQYLRAQLVESLPEDIVITDLEGNIVDVNKAAELSTGYSRRELTGKNPIIFNASENAKAIERQIMDCLQQSRIWSGEMLQRDRYGNKRMSEFGIFPIKDGDETIALGSIKRDITEQKRMQRALRENEKKFRMLFNNARDCILVHEVKEDGLVGRILEVNDTACRITGYSRDELLKMLVYDIEEKDHQRERITKIQSEINRTGRLSFETVIITKDGRKIPLEVNSSRFHLNGKYVELAIARDISQHRQVEELLQVKSAAMKASMDGMAILNSNQEYIYLNDSHIKIYGYDNENELIGKSWKVLYNEDEIKRIEKEVIPVLIDTGRWRGEAIGRRRDGSTFYQEISLSILNDGGMVCVVRDISHRRELENNLRFLSLHDSLTGLFNRAYFQQELKRISKKGYSRVGVIVCDVDGLKLVNDTLGHKKGDEILISAANILKETFSTGQVIARIGGDEFAIIIPDNTPAVLEKYCKEIKDNITRQNAKKPELPLSMSAGYAASDENSLDFDELFKKADNNMYRQKLYQNQSRRSTIVQTLNRALKARDFITEGHIERLQDLVVKIAVEIGLPEYKLTDLRLFAQFHDIGKVGIPDRILFKKGPLTTEEMNEMQRHSEIGFRIVQSSPDLIPIADWILKNHEWWNGKGYPFGLRGEEIPLECRILAIADAYDAMTSKRPYREAMTHREAVAELVKCAGVQFDPRLVQTFTRIITENYNVSANSPVQSQRG